MPANPLDVLSPPQVMTEAAEASALAYWTPERKAAALPIPLPRIYIPRRPESAATERANALTTPVIVAPASPDRPERAAEAGGFTTTRVADMTVYPYAIVGKLFMSFGTQNFVGSAWVIGERAIFTAGHCVNDNSPDSYASRVVFEAQYANGDSAGSWVMSNLGALRGWVEQHENMFQYDMAVGIASTPIRPVTGKAGYVANQATDVSPFLSVGYPARNPFDGETMWSSEGGFVETSLDFPNDNIVGMHNNMTQGCSGGPWFTRKFGGVHLACGLNSFGFVSERNIMRSPYFGTEFLSLVQWMKDQGGDTVADGPSNPPDETPQPASRGRRRRR